METLEHTDTIKITEGAQSIVKDLLVQKNVPDYGLRIFVSGGGCSGMQYGMALDAEPGENDFVIRRQRVHGRVHFLVQVFAAESTRSQVIPRPCHVERFTGANAGAQVDA